MYLLAYEGYSMLRFKNFALRNVELALSSVTPQLQLLENQIRFLLTFQVLKKFKKLLLRQFMFWFK